MGVRKSFSYSLKQEEPKLSKTFGQDNKNGNI